MREIRPSGSEGGARFNPLSLPLSGVSGYAAADAGKEVLRSNQRRAIRSGRRVSVCVGPPSSLPSPPKPEDSRSTYFYAFWVMELRRPERVKRVRTVVGGNALVSRAAFRSSGMN